MTRLKLALLASALAFLAVPAASAQVVRQMVVQSNFVDRNQREAPAVSVVVRADFVLFAVSLETGTKSADAREQELAKTFKTLTDRAAKAEGMSIEVGQPGRSAAIETAAAKEIIQVDGDRSSIDTVLKVMVKDKETFDAIRARAEKFVSDTPMTGRAEAVIGDNQFLGLSDPMKQRAVLLDAIAKDTAAMQTTFRAGGQANVTYTVSGLEQRVLTRPVGPLDLEIYIPYTIQIRTGAGQ